MKTKSLRISSWTLEILLYLAFTLFVTGHLVNAFSPRALNPLENFISQYAACPDGGALIGATIILFAICEFLLGFVILSMDRGNAFLSLGALFLAASAMPMRLVALYHTIDVTNPGRHRFLSTVMNWFHANPDVAVANAYDSVHGTMINMAFLLLVIAIALSCLGLMIHGAHRRLAFFCFVVVPLVIAFDLKTGGTHPGLWQRCTFLAASVWMLAMARGVRNGSAPKIPVKSADI